MPIVGVGRDRLFAALGEQFTDDSFDELCFEYGIELDDVTSEQEMLQKGQGLAAEASCSSEEVIYKIDIPANRYDMLCLEGIARALNIFRSKIPNVKYTLGLPPGQKPLRMVIKPETALVRPFVACAVLRGIHFDQARYNSFIDLQDKLHQNLCRQRSLVAIGTHDLSTLQGPFTYEALPPADISFVPLKQQQEFNAAALLQHYLDHDQKLKKFVHIIKDSVVYPALYDSRRTLLSLPPVINGAHSAISLHTQDVFIEVTGTDEVKTHTVLNMVSTMFSEYCSTPYQIEPVEVIDAFGNSQQTPRLQSRELDVDMAYINGCTGLDLQADKAAALLSRMALSAQASPDGQSVHVLVPPTRSDVLHPCDVMEDVAIAWGFNNLHEKVPQTVAVGSELPLNQLTEMLRMECAMAGFTEIATWALISRAENFAAVRKQDDGQTAVSVGNPATIEFEVCRTSLLPGALKTLGASRDAPLPVRLFEVADVVLTAPLDSSQVGAVNRRRLVALICDKTSGFEIIHGLLNRVMETLGVPVLDDGGQLSAEQDKNSLAKFRGGYQWQPSDVPTFFPGRQASVSITQQLASGPQTTHIGHFGILHPAVLASFDITFPVSALEIDVEPFCFNQTYKSLPTHLYVG